MSSRFFRPNFSLEIFLGRNHCNGCAISLHSGDRNSLLSRKKARSSCSVFLKSSSFFENLGTRFSRRGDILGASQPRTTFGVFRSTILKISCDIMTRHDIVTVATDNLFGQFYPGLCPACTLRLIYDRSQTTTIFTFQDSSRFVTFVLLSDQA